MKVIFRTDFEYDYHLIWIMLKLIKDPAGNLNRALTMGLTEDQYNFIVNASNLNEIKPFLIDYTKSKYDLYSKNINEAIINYQNSRNKINNYFFERIEKITGFKWKYKEYFVNISPIHEGVSNKFENDVVRTCFETPEEQLRITAHEILMTHIRNIFMNIFDDSKEDINMIYWGMNEIVSTSILGLETQFNILRTEDMKGYDNFLGNYPQLFSIMEPNKKLYYKKNDFLSYLNNLKQLFLKKKIHDENNKLRIK